MVEEGVSLFSRWEQDSGGRQTLWSLQRVVLMSMARRTSSRFLFLGAETRSSAAAGPESPIKYLKVSRRSCRFGNRLEGRLKRLF